MICFFLQVALFVLMTTTAQAAAIPVKTVDPDPGRDAMVVNRQSPTSHPETLRLRLDNVRHELITQLRELRYMSFHKPIHSPSLP